MHSGHQRRSAYLGHSWQVTVSRRAKAIAVVVSHAAVTLFHPLQKRVAGAPKRSVHTRPEGSLFLPPLSSLLSLRQEGKCRVFLVEPTSFGKVAYTHKPSLVVCASPSRALGRCYYGRPLLPTEGNLSKCRYCPSPVSKSDTLYDLVILNPISQSPVAYSPV